MKLTPFLSLVALTCALSPSARAGELFTNFTAPDGFTMSSGAVVRGANVGPEIELFTASPFSPTATGYLDTIEIAISASDGLNSTIRVAVHEDDGGLPGAMIEDLGLVDGPASPTLVPATSAAHTLLSAGTDYWVVCYPNDADSAIRWSTNEGEIFGTAFFGSANQWTFLNGRSPAVRVNGFQSAELYDNLSASETFLTTNAYPLWGSASSPQVYQAASFSVDTETVLANVGLAVFKDGPPQFGFEDDLTVSLRLDAFGVPGATVETLGVVSDLPDLSQQLTFINSPTNPTLSPGQTYWIVCVPADPMTVAVWARNSEGATGRATTTSGEGGWISQSSIQPAFVLGGWTEYSSFCDANDGALTSCPCANAGSPDAGCDLPQGTGGVRLDVVARSTAPQNSATLQASGFPATATPTAIVIRAEDREASPVVFGDGLRCVGNPVVRLTPTFAAGGVSEHVIGHGAMAGSGTFHYQVWFRSTPGSFCTPDAFNLSNGRTIVW